MRRAFATGARTAATPVTVQPRPRPRVLSPTTLVRTFANSSRSEFFFRRPTVAPSQIVQDIDNAARDGRPDVVAKLYPSLVEAIKTSSAPTPLVSQRKMQSFMRSIAKSNRINLLLKMFQDVTTVFGYDVTPLDHHILVIGLVNSGKTVSATRWLESMPDTHGIRPHVSDFNVVLNGWRRKRNLFEMRNLIHLMRTKYDLEPNLVSYNTFISALFENGKIDEVRKLRLEMESKGIEPDLYTETALLTGFVDVGEMGSAKEVQKRLAPIVYEAAQSGVVDPSRYDTAMVNALLKYEARVEGFDRALALADKYRQGGIPLDLWTLNSLLLEGSKGLTTAREGLRLIERLEDLVDVQADRRAWSVVINSIAKSQGGIEPALELYQLARDRSIEPDTTMIHPLVECLLTPAPTPETFATARSLYEDLSTTSLSRDLAPEQPIYALLLRACANPATLDVAYSRHLIADMKSRGIKLDASTALSHIESLMRASTSFEEAFEAYDELRALDPSVLSDTSAYNQVLSTFLSLNFASTSSSSSAPPELVMEFLSDMRTSLHPANSTTYSILLTYYSRTASASIPLIQRLHSLIKLDVNLDPNTALFNSLMSAYSRVGAYSYTYRIWDSIVANAQNSDRSGKTATTSRGPDQRSLSILLDTCGYDKSRNAQTRARDAWQDREITIVKNKKNWDTWVECLCRWNRFDEAEQVVFEEMKRTADVETLEVLLKFARTFGVESWERVRERIRKERPELWSALEQVAAGDKKPVKGT
ncbi:pentatricopeptide repeat-containing protein [Sporobolomyces koalae]|uniref:pentatricopeptide repeat-containing protein n=1 Tax=Sporobolomyces koalae TaxID=500713 RepID=UPI00316B493D